MQITATRVAAAVGQAAAARNWICGIDYPNRLSRCGAALAGVVRGLTRVTAGGALLPSRAWNENACKKATLTALPLRVAGLKRHDTTARRAASPNSVRVADFTSVRSTNPRSSYTTRITTLPPIPRLRNAVRPGLFIEAGPPVSACQLYKMPASLRTMTTTTATPMIQKMEFFMIWFGLVLAERWTP
jgi:hypothetical protein